MAIIGEEIEGYVQNQITARQTLHGSGVGHTGNLRTDKQINLLNSNTSWIKLASGVSISKSNRLTELGLPTSLIGMGLAKNNILFSGTSKLINGQLEQREGFLPRDVNSSYTYGSFGFSPMPGIISADIKTLTRGSLKKATVKLIANNKQQFDIIDLLYMRLGYTVLFEWGNSIYTTNGGDKKTLGNTLIEDKFFESSGNDSYFTFLEDIENKRYKHDGNYDALLGKISNFNWSFNSDGSYSIELTIISLGDVIESLKSNLSVDKVTNAFLKLIIPLAPAEESSVVDIVEGGASGEGKSAYPELPFLNPPPPANLLSYKDTATKLKALTDLSTAKAVFAIMWAEASKNKEKLSFRSAGGYNYSGVQTDSGRWGAGGIIARYRRIDVGNNNREFAVFADDNAFLKFMISRIKAKGFDGSNGDSWTTTYINKWWSPAKKAEYTKGTTTYNNKLAIYKTAIQKFNN